MSGEDAKKEAIEATPEWYDALQQLPFKSSKHNCYRHLNIFCDIGNNGKTLHLLKKKAKPIGKREKRKVIPLLGTIHDYHVSKQKVPAPAQNQMPNQNEGPIQSSLADGND